MPATTKQARIYRTEFKMKNLQMYILMIDHGRTGLEAVVHPEDTRADIVQAYRDASHPVFVKFVDGNEIIDVTDEIRAEALEAAHVDFEVDVQAANFDHARDFRRNEVA